MKNLEPNDNLNNIIENNIQEEKPQFSNIQNLQEIKLFFNEKNLLKKSEEICKTNNTDDLNSSKIKKRRRFRFIKLTSQKISNFLRSLKKFDINDFIFDFKVSFLNFHFFIF